LMMLTVKETPKLEVLLYFKVCQLHVK